MFVGACGSIPLASNLKHDVCVRLGVASSIDSTRDFAVVPSGFDRLGATVSTADAHLALLISATWQANTFGEFLVLIEHHDPTFVLARQIDEYIASLVIGESSPDSIFVHELHRMMGNRSSILIHNHASDPCPRRLSSMRTSVVFDSPVASVTPYDSHRPGGQQSN